MSGFPSLSLSLSLSLALGGESEWLSYQNMFSSDLCSTGRQHQAVQPHHGLGTVVRSGGIWKGEQVIQRTMFRRGKARLCQEERTLERVQLSSRQ